MGILGVVTGYKSPQATTKEAHVGNCFIGSIVWASGLGCEGNLS